MAIFKWKAVAIVCAACLSSWTVVAASQGDWDECTSANTDRAIPACTRIINDSDTAPKDHSDAYIWRANNYLGAGKLDLAIADYGEAIKLTPKSSTALASRAIANYRNGNTDLAIVDYSVAQRFNSKNIDEMTTASADLKAIANLALKTPIPTTKLDAIVDQLIPKGCEPGYQLNGSECVPINCPSGQQLSGASCQAIECPAGQILQGETCTTAPRYIAIALGTTNHVFMGVVWNRSTVEDAKDGALDECHKRANSRRSASKCKVIHAVANSCISIYWLPTGTGWGTAVRPTMEDAESAALSSCQSYNQGQRCVRGGAWCNR